MKDTIIKTAAKNGMKMLSKDATLTEVIEAYNTLLVAAFQDDVVVDTSNINLLPQEVKSEIITTVTSQEEAYRKLQEERQSKENKKAKGWEEEKTRQMKDEENIR